MRTPCGWIVRTYWWDIEKDVPVDLAMTFVPDPDHAWNLEEE